jgi:hypothetical protein
MHIHSYILVDKSFSLLQRHTHTYETETGHEGKYTSVAYSTQQKVKEDLDVGIE